jgi:hypothetical protein
LHHDLEFATAADKSGYWFALAVLFAVLAAGIIVYRGANPDYDSISVATNTHSNGDAPPPYVHNEAVDP